VRFSAAMRFLTITVIVVVVFALAAAMLSGCGGKSATTANSSASTETTPGQFPATTPNPGAQPPPPALKDPRTAVYSYQLWISYAYRVLNSDVASRTFDPDEEVRVNSYVMYNFQEGRAIDQRLLVAKVKNWRSEGSTATVAMHEEWIYRYISTKTGKYMSPALNAAYETTYTLVRRNDDWVVHSVQAAPGAAVK
jgi:hypothetical protein